MALPDFILKLRDLVSGPARAMADHVQRLKNTQDAATSAAERMQGATSKVGQAASEAARKVAQHTRETERSAAASDRAAAAADRMRRAVQSQVLGGAALRVNAAGQVAVDPFQQRFRAAAPGTGSVFRVTDYLRRQRLAATNGDMHGPVFDREAQGLNLPHGPVLDRGAQWRGFSFRQKATFVGSRVGDEVSKLGQWNAGVGETLSRWGELSSAFMRTPFGFVLSGVASVASGLLSIVQAGLSAAMTLGKVVAAAGAFAAVAITKKALEMTAFAESARTSFRFLTGDALAGKMWMTQAVQTARDLGAPLEQTIDSFKTLRAMQFGLEQSNALVRMSADLVAVTGHADAAERAIRAITQIKGAGRLLGEELNQLAEAGVSRDLIYQQLEQKYGIGRAALLKKQQAGEIDASTAIEAIQRAVAIKLHTDRPGDAARDFSERTLTGMWARFRNLPDLVMLRLADGIETGPVRRAIKKLSEALNGIEGDGITRFVNTVLSYVPKAADALIGFVDGFGSGVSRLIAQMPTATGDFQEWGRTAGAAVVRFYEMIVSGISWVATNGPVLWSKFLEGLNVKSVAESFAAIDFPALAVSLGELARLIGDIANQIFQLVGPMQKMLDFATSPFGRFLANVSTGDTIGNLKLLREQMQGSSDGAEPENMPPPLPQAPVVRPFRAAAAGAAGKTENNIEMNITLTGSATEEDGRKVARYVMDGVSGGLRRATRGALHGT